MVIIFQHYSNLSSSPNNGKLEFFHLKIYFYRILRQILPSRMESLPNTYEFFDVGHT